MVVLSIGYGRHLFKAGDSEKERIILCARELSELHMIIFTLKQDGLKITNCENNLVLYPTNSKSRWLMVYDAFKIGSRIISDRGKEVVVTTQDPLEAGLVGYMLKMFYGIYLNVQEHADIFSLRYWRQETGMNFFRYWMGLYILRRADTIRVVSKRIQETIEKMDLSAHLRRLPVAINLEPFLLQDNLDYGKVFNENEFRYISVARFVKQKNFPLMIQAFARAHERNDKVRLTIVGRGPEEEIIKKEINLAFKETDSNSCPVEIIGWSDDIPSLMKSADAYLLSSNYEGWARVLIEAICSHLPVVTTDVGCAGEVVIDGQHGYVVPPKDVQALSEAIFRMSSDKSQYDHFRNNLSSIVPSDIPGTDMKAYGQLWVKSLL